MPTFNEEALKKWNEKNLTIKKERLRNQRAKYRARTKEENQKIVERRQEYYKKNREKILEQKRQQRNEITSKLNGLKIKKGDYVVHFE